MNMTQTRKGREPRALVPGYGGAHGVDNASQGLLVRVVFQFVELYIGHHVKVAWLLSKSVKSHYIGQFFYI